MNKGQKPSKKISIHSRNHSLDAKSLKMLTADYSVSKDIPNPYSKGAYFYFIEALKGLGANTSHPFVAVKEQMRKLMNAAETRDASKATAWARFSQKKDVATDCNGRIKRNGEVLQRVSDYGLKLVQVGKKVLKTKGIVVDIMKGTNDSPQYRLNTDSNKP